MAEEAHPTPATERGQSSSDPHQATEASGVHGSSQSAGQMFPSVVTPVQNQEQNGHGRGLYAVQCLPLTGMMPGCPQNMLIPLTYKMPVRNNSTDAAGEEQGQGGQAARQQVGPHRQVVVRRFQVAFQLDLALLLKLAFAVVLFGQDGSRQRTIILILLASLVYLYQTGVLTPLIQYVRRGLAPPRPVARPQNVAARQNDENAGNEDQNQPADANQQPPEPERMNLWGFVREIQTFVIGFITSLLPGFEQHND
ncbi:uncharacterized protein LOC109841383 isoform X2 [Asparagus officinalis]|uniref:uncharacterized protein LOC109841383 isoform X2 n=1 Tax=Asparagus officinalis TaxID=4686 RepID=UPI00098E3FE4|nr:uncharacterized protein LOC109841383 isoform X2 [Asparagus officinalis]